MIQYPLIFNARAEAESGTQAPWAVRCGDQKTLCCVPVEFAGGGGGFSPEDLYLQALSNCFLATLKVYAEASKIDFRTITLDAKLTVDKNDQGQPWMKEADFRVVIQGASKPDRLRTLVDKTIRGGFILNSVKTHLNWSVEIAE